MQCNAVDGEKVLIVGAMIDVVYHARTAAFQAAETLNKLSTKASTTVQISLKTMVKHIVGLTRLFLWQVCDCLGLSRSLPQSIPGVPAMEAASQNTRFARGGYLFTVRGQDSE